MSKIQKVFNGRGNAKIAHVKMANDSGSNRMLEDDLEGFF